MARTASEHLMSITHLVVPYHRWFLGEALGARTVRDRKDQFQQKCVRWQLL